MGGISIWQLLIVLVIVVLLLPIIIDPTINSILRKSPEAIEAEKEAVFAKIYSSEEE